MTDHSTRPTTSGGGARRAVPLFFHGLAAAWIGAMLLFAATRPERYEAAMQEDRAVEWATVALFLAAGAVGLRRSLRDRRPFDVLVALFCLFVAGEEISWGQRLVGYTPPAPFLERNWQQEMNLHNFADVIGQPKWSFIAALVGYGVLLPALARVGPGRAVLAKAGATPPPAALVPWFVAAAVLFYWYPVRFTGEWVELLAGAAFLAAAGAMPVSLAVTFGAAALVGLVMTAVSAAGRAADPDRLACARTEAAAIVSAIVDEGAATQQLKHDGNIHKRVRGSILDGYLEPEALRGLAAVPCRGESAGARATRRRYAVDPWGTAYWLYRERGAVGERVVTVYSFGPNRRRDGEPGAPTGDDIAAVGILRIR